MLRWRTTLECTRKRATTTSSRGVRRQGYLCAVCLWAVCYRRTVIWRIFSPSITVGSLVPTTDVGFGFHQTKGRNPYYYITEPSIYWNTMRNAARVATLCWLIGLVQSFAPPFVSKQWLRPSSQNHAVSSSSSLSMKYTLVLVRHGESTWNMENKVRRLATDFDTI